jgi:hypothetical protein
MASDINIFKFIKLCLLKQHILIREKTQKLIRIKIIIKNSHYIFFFKLI